MVRNLCYHASRHLQRCSVAEERRREQRNAFPGWIQHKDGAQEGLHTSNTLVRTSTPAQTFFTSPQGASRNHSGQTVASSAKHSAPALCPLLSNEDHVPWRAQPSAPWAPAPGVMELGDAAQVTLPFEPLLSQKSVSTT